MIKFLYLIIGGAVGTVGRYLLSGFVYRIAGAAFPYGTLVVNLTGCFIIGFLVSISDNKFMLGTNAKVLLMIGFCGAFTTFSALIMETNGLIKDGETLRAFMNVLVSVVFGFIVFRLGVLLGEVI
jgi:CrcB protein